jgi:hypothetical protein
MKGLVAAALLLAACDGDIDSSMTTGDAAGSGSNHVYMDAPAGAGEPANLTGITDAHNTVRAMVDTTGIAAGPLPPMVWDPQLATLAMNWASQCIDADNNGFVDHSSQTYRTNAAGYSYVGENIFASGGAASAAQAVQTWAAEKSKFTYPTGCAGTCGHYTQIVWRTSIHVGCANVTCNGLQYKGNLVCNYGPGGNSGGAPY